MKEEYDHFINILVPNIPYVSYSITDSQGSSVRGLGPLSTINIFIGTNNSGKSRLIRALFAKEQFGFATKNYNPQIFKDFLLRIEPEFNAIMSNFYNFIDIKEDSIANLIKSDQDFMLPEDPINKKIEDFIATMKRTATAGGTFNAKPTSNLSDQTAKSMFGVLGENASTQFNEIIPKIKVMGEKRYYIPILRGMRPLDDEQINLYHQRTIKDYFSKAGKGNTLVGEKHLFTGIELYQTLKAKLLGEPEDREAVKEFEDYLSRKFFGSRQITLIPREGDTTVYIKIGKDKQLAIYELGDGLQSLIICSFNIFMEKTPCLFFIEEPDLCMHPSMQRAFLEMLLEYKHHQYFFTTHSNHFLDMTIDFGDISVFHFTKKNETDNFQITATSTRDHNLLRDLGVRNSSVFLTNSTIWVEGITDRLYLRAYLKKYCEELKNEGNSKFEELGKLLEDFHYTFVEYQGAPLTHWNFDADADDIKKINAAFLCANALLIADGDVLGKGNREETFKKMLGNRFVPLPVKEIENLIPVEILKHVVEDKFTEKAVNVDVIKYVEYSKLNAKLGEYLDKKLKLLATEAAIYKAKSGTIKPKMAFCEKAIKAMSDLTLDWKLTPELRELCEKIYKHILNENK
jgi:hypothetical protein